MTYAFIRVQISCGLTGRWPEPGYRLSNGAVLLDDQLDAEGNYYSSIGMDGLYLRTDARYRPLYNSQQQLRAFEKIE